MITVGDFSVVTTILAPIFPILSQPGYSSTEEWDFRGINGESQHKFKMTHYPNSEGA
jgi:hypothetical protein